MHPSYDILGFRERIKNDSGWLVCPDRDLLVEAVPVFYCVPCRWTDPLIWQGMWRPLTQEDLYAHPQEVDSKKLLNKFNR